jgi:hypothetical protein
MTLPPNVRRYAPRVAAGGVLAIGLTALAALPSAAAPDFKAQFTRLDVNGDGVLSVEEFLGPKPADSAKDNVVIETRRITRSDDKPPTDIKIEPAVMKKDAVAFYLPEELSGGSEKAADNKHEYTLLHEPHRYGIGYGLARPQCVQRCKPSIWRRFVSWYWSGI